LTRACDPQLKCVTCSKWFCGPQHWLQGHPPCRGRSRMMDERLGLETADQMLYKRLKQAFAAGSPLTELKRLAVDADILKPTECDPSYIPEVNDDAILYPTSPLMLPKQPSPKPKIQRGAKLNPSGMTMVLGHEGLSSPYQASDYDVEEPR